MAQVSLPYRPKSGDPEVIEEILADLDAILAAVNGGIDSANLAPGKILDPDKIRPSGASGGQVLQWNGTSWAPATLPAAPAAQTAAGRVYGTAGTSVRSGSNPVLSWGAEDFDTDGVFDPAAPTRLTAPVAGVYHVIAQALWLAGQAGQRRLMIRWVGAVTVGETRFDSGGGVLVQQTAMYVAMSAGTTWRRSSRRTSARR